MTGGGKQVVFQVVMAEDETWKNNTRKRKPKMKQNEIERRSQSRNNQKHQRKTLKDSSSQFCLKAVPHQKASCADSWAQSYLFSKLEWPF